ncbi:MAG: hypothetical protein NT176_01975 [Proteobacteria bacterium]|nr:hypothetical protein [Pseudomonadota bacterium]
MDLGHLAGILQQERAPPERVRHPVALEFLEIHARAQVFGGNPFDHGEEYIGTRRRFLRPAGDERRIGPTNGK